MTDSSLIDRIVNGVLNQLGTSGGTSVAKSSPQSGSVAEKVPAAATTRQTPLTIADKVITADLLGELLNGERSITVNAKAIVTPAARDFLKEQGIQLQRGEAGEFAPGTPAGTSSAAAGTVAAAKLATAPLLIVVKHTTAVDSLWEQLQPTWKRELVGCPDDAARLAIGELSRGGATQVVILAEQTFRAACLANRNDRVKAVPVASPLDVKAARTQLRVNTWCVDPTDRSWFELRNLFKSFTPSP